MVPDEQLVVEHVRLQAQIGLYGPGYHVVSFLLAMQQQLRELCTLFAVPPEAIALEDQVAALRRGLTNLGSHGPAEERGASLVQAVLQEFIYMKPCRPEQVCDDRNIL